MFLRWMIFRQNCLHFSHDRSSNSIPSINPFEFKYELPPPGSAHFNTDSSKSKVTSHVRQSSRECPVVSSDLHRLLSIDNRFDLLQFLRHLIVSERFYDEVKRLVGEQERDLAFSQVLTLVDMYSWNQRMEGVDMMQYFAAKRYPKELDAQSNFAPHKIICDNLNDPIRTLTQLLDMSSSRSHLKAVVLSQAELLLNRVISRGSRSAVDKVNKFLVYNCCPEQRGPLLCSSWVSFYLSPYEDDQIRAAKILRENEQVMMPHLDLTLSSVGKYLLDGRQLNRYYVLLQIFSKRSHRKKTEDLLKKLFHHFYKTNNLRGCLTCESLARELNLCLPHDIKYQCDLIKKSKSANLSGLDMKFIF